MSVAPRRRDGDRGARAAAVARVRRFGALAAVLAMALTLGACQQLLPDVFGPGDTGPPDTVTVRVVGLPDELAPALTLTGPDGLALELDRATSVGDLPAGTYRLHVHEVAYGVTTFSADPDAVETTLVAGRGATLTARYAPDRVGARAALARLNAYREAAGLPAVTLDEEALLPHWLHARYATLNGTTGHFEDPDLPWYTEDGDRAARMSNLSYRWSVHYDGGADDLAVPHASWIDTFADAPFHFFSLLDPRTAIVRSAWFAAAVPCDDVAWVHPPYPDACRVVRATGVVQAVHGDQAWPAGTTVLYPGRDQTVTVLDHGPEYPDPLTACPGYERPVGLPLFVMEAPVGGWSDGAWRWDAPTLVRTRLTLDGEALEHCAFDAERYTNPDPSARDLARAIMGGRGAVVLVPRRPLLPGRSYQVEVVTDRGAHAWTFRTAAAAATTTRPLDGRGWVEGGAGGR